MAGSPNAGPAPTRCGFVAVLGAPNVGKSTLVNRMVGAKVTIVSPKVQTTRFRVLGIVTVGATQVVLTDTPGIFTPRRRLDRAMVAAAWSGARDSDEVLLLVDSVRGIDADTSHILDRLAAVNRRARLVLNKIDLVDKRELLVLAEQLSARYPFEATFMVSAKSGDGVDDLVGDLAARLPEGPWHFPEDQLSDMPDRLLAAEITREKLYLQLSQELPYVSAVETEGWTERADGSVRIDQVIYVERTSHKAIVIGEKGSRIRKLGSEARKDLEVLLERPVHLFLFVKARQGWAEDRQRYHSIGLDFDA